MSIIRVAVPVFRGKRKFYIKKGRPWSPFEHLILQALVIKPRSASELSEASALPKRLVIEALIRLMRADWVEVSQAQSNTIFRSTATGVESARMDELPNVPRIFPRWMTFVVDKVTGTTFRGRELALYEKHVLEEREKSEKIVWVQPSSDLIREEPSAIFSTLLDEDETIVDVEMSGDRLSERYALIHVRNGNVENIPKSASDLEIVVLNAAKRHNEDKNDGHNPHISSNVEFKRKDQRSPKIHQIGFQQSDVILGGDAHRSALLNSIRRAREHVIIHSTFVREAALNNIIPAITDAARRGVTVDILWGQNEEKAAAGETLEILAKARGKITALGLESLVSFHHFSTDSHAKIIVADDGQTSRYAAIVGSCNWLYSGFDSYEASVRLRDPEVVADTLDVLTELSRGTLGFWTPLTIKLASLARSLRGKPRPTGSKMEAAIVLGAQHGAFVRKARDEALRRIFVCSHRFGVGAKQSVIIPAIAAAKSSKGIETGIYYGRVSGKATGTDVSQLTLEAGKDNVLIRPVHDPRLHAKILAWDDDAALITSQNWLSADPVDHQPYQEVGVYLRGSRIADQIITSFKNSLQ